MKKLLLGGLLVLAAGTVLAESDKLSLLDTDKDGLLSLEEAKVDVSLSAAFAELDLNQDGYLSEAELKINFD